MVLFLATPIPGEYQKPIALFIAGLAFLVHGAWCRYMGETDEYYPSDSRVLPYIPMRGMPKEEPEIDIGFDAKFLICMVVGGGLVLLAALAFPFNR